MEELDVANRYVMPELRDKAYRRLSSIEGQIRGLKKMLEENRPCMEILVQLSAVQEAMRGVTKLMMRNYLERCATDAIQSKDPEKLKATYDEIMDVFFKHVR
ncbi:metal-sensitive transcriptional regulator [Symbiobacterium terraclitae]|uniref:metal-sensitive transcriptional regulator n=1 Tax=Symbiobacterium terraclitae TaxID=557451 RepID=UPI0035B501E9